MKNHTQRLCVVNGKLAIVATFHRHKLKYDYYRRTINKKECRNLYGNNYGKWVRIPGVKYNNYGHYITEEKERWGLMEKKINGNLAEYVPVTQKDVDLFEKHYPGFHYVIEKCSKHWIPTYEYLFDVLEIWIEHPQIEILLDKGFSYIALNKNFWKLKPATQKKYIQILKNLNGENPTMDMLAKLKKGYTIEQYKIMHSAEFYDYEKRKYVSNFQTVEYIRKMKITPREYFDYCSMAKSLNHDLTDPYWEFPTNFQQRHAKVLDEHAEVKALEKKKEFEKWQNKYSKVVKKFQTVTDFNDIHVFVPQNISMFTKQAEKLHQCIIAAGYYKNVAEKKKILVFLEKDNIPYATAELLTSRKKFYLNQFYGDERLPDYLAQDDARQALDQWLQDSKITLAS